MSNHELMKEVLNDLLPDLMALHQATKNERLRLRIEKYIERINEALGDHGTIDNGRENKST